MSLKGWVRIACLCAAVSSASAQELPPEPAGAPALPDDVTLPTEPGEPDENPPPSLTEPPGAPPLVESIPPNAIFVRAARARVDGETRSLALEGGVTIIAPDRTVSSPSAVYSIDSGELVVEGPAVMADSRQVMTCKTARFNLRSKTGELTEVHVEVRDPMDAAAREYVAAIRRAPPGKKRAIVDGERVRVLSPERFNVKNAYVTTCDCENDSGPVPWSLKAREAVVYAGETAFVWFPTIYVMSVPVAVLPFFVVPLSRRQSGLLFPELRFQDGVWISQPAFITLGDSADVTVAPGIVVERGPRLALEGRAAPAPDSYVEAQLTYQRDAKHIAQRSDRATLEHAPERIPYEPRVWNALGLRSARTVNGEPLDPNRFSTRMLARSRVRRLSLGGELNLVGDRELPRDFAVSLGDRVAQYLRSATQVSVGQGDLYASLQLVTFQDLRQGHLSMFSPYTGALGHRLPILQFRILERPLLPSLGPLRSPLVGRALVGLDHQAVLGNRDSSTTDGDIAATNEVFTNGRLGDVTRAVLQPELTVPLSFGRFGGARASLVGREAVFILPDGSVADVTRVTARARAETELSATMRAPRVKDALHRIRPYLAYEGVLFARASRAGSTETPWLDEADRYGRYHAVGAGLFNELRIGQVLGAPVRVVTDGRAAVDLMDLRRQEWVWRSTLEANALSTGLRFAVDPDAREVTFLQTWLDVGRIPYAVVHAGYTRIGSRTPRFMVAGENELLGALRLDGPRNPTGSDRLDALIAIPIGNFRWDYGAEVAFNRLELKANQLRLDEVEPVVMTHGGTLAYVSQCKCWSAAARVRFFPRGRNLTPQPIFGFAVSITGPDGELQLFK